MSDMGEVDTNLVGSTCFQSACKKARQRFAVRSKKALQHLPVGYGRSPVGADRLFVPRMGVPSERGIDGAFCAIRRSPYKREVATLEGPFAFLGELFGECMMGFIGFGRHQKAGGVLVESMHDAWPFDAADARQARTTVRDQCIDQRAGSVAGRRMDDQAARLVDDDNRVI